ncbi:hypothetical protein OF001_U180079 [Pseudomonas sp. OF001]|nr:hypothetical protein OF001_U180079 [Pseudomonas sp. OF001]
MRRLLRVFSCVLLLGRVPVGRWPGSGRAGRADQPPPRRHARHHQQAGALRQPDGRGRLRRALHHVRAALLGVPRVRGVLGTRRAQPALRRRPRRPRPAAADSAAAA